MVPYIIQVAAFQLVFLMIYDAFLKKETFFNWNRIYLLSTALLSVFIPFIRLEVFKNVIPQQYIINLPEVIIGNAKVSNQNPIQLETIVIKSKTFWTWENLFYVGMILATILLLFKLVKVLILLYKNPKMKLGHLLIVNLLNSNSAFSFFNYIFLGDGLNDNDKEAILKHEMVHVKQKHTLDLLFFEVMRILFWFNPLVYMYQNRIMTLHEFIADQEVVKHQDKTQYYQNLLSQVFQTQNISFINPFYKQSLIKKRIVMLQKSKSKQIHLLKYALLIPMVIGMLVYTSSDAQNKPSGEKIIATEYSFQTFYDEGLKEKIYKEYLENKNPNEAKKLLEKDIKEGILRLFVVDVDNLTTKEKEKFNDKKKLLDTGDYFTQLHVNNIDGKKNSWLFGSNDVSKTNNIDDSKAVVFGDMDMEVSFAKVNQVPVFPSCEDLASNEDKKKCTSNKITEFVNKNFNTKVAEDLGLTGRQRITVLFKIDTEGNIKDVQSRAPHPALETEANRVINTLPKMIPGKQKGKKVVVPYALPIVFMVADNNETETVTSFQTKQIDSDKDYSDSTEVPYAVVEKVPVFGGCEDLLSNDEKKKCTSDRISEHVGKNFNTKVAEDLGLTGRQRITVLFKIDTEGHIVDIKARASHPALEAETIRVIKTLPKMIPGEQRGKKVMVPYALPIMFAVQDDEPELEKK
ncbi:M56 family metallopeptidase [Confluentibacter sediminis]|uniref:M56 family metallopeptidase n=1 Tax=Confluentibacter sediminis TaxID=2219045 RepID=UPI001F38E60C|nr:M56 family metallopeptidase [Confluentibacter sediminis]